VIDQTKLLERRIGTTLRNKWTLERLIGAGGMAAVYVGLHKIGRRDAIKILHADIAADKEQRQRFEREAQAVNRFRHPGAVEILDVDVTEDGAPFLVMELLDGEPLAARMKRGAMEQAEVLRVADALLDVLAAAHEAGIIHRDIKPDNLFLLRDGRVKVLDFGIARMRQSAPRTLYTAYGVTIGTLSYMPPEQVAGKEIDARADLFAVGCTLFQMVSGRRPHEGNNDIELMAKMGLEPAPPLATVCPSAPPDLCAVIDRALAFDRERRYPDARTMQADVRALCEGRSPLYAAGRLALGELPNPVRSAAAGAAAVSAANAATVGPWSAAVVVPAPGEVMRMPSMPEMAGAGRMPSMPEMAGAGRMPTMPEMVEARPAMMSVAAASAEHASAASAPRASAVPSKRQAAVAMAAVALTLLVVCVALFATLGRKEAPEEAALATQAPSTEPSAEPSGESSATPRDEGHLQLAPDEPHEPQADEAQDEDEPPLVVATPKGETTPRENPKTPTSSPVVVPKQGGTPGVTRADDGTIVITIPDGVLFDSKGNKGKKKR